MNGRVVLEPKAVLTSPVIRRILNASPGFHIGSEFGVGGDNLIWGILVPGKLTQPSEDLIL